MRNGFTLIEIIIYVALISLIVGFVLTAIYRIIDSKSAYMARADVEEETNFLIKKIKWAMSNVSAVNQPNPNTTSTTLSVDKFNYVSNPVVISLSGSDVNISYAGGSPTILNSGNVAVRDLMFEHISGGNNPAIKVKLSVEYRHGDLKTPKPSTTAETTIYLRNQ